jgi:hypothetical protein
MLLNHNIKPINCYIKKEFLYNQEKHHGEFVEAHLFAVSSIRGRALGFHAFLNNGAIFYRLPLSAIVWKRNELANVALEDLQTWDQLGYYLSVIEYDFLKELNGKVFLNQGRVLKCEYLFTIDFCHPDPGVLNTSFVESPEDHKCQHLVRLENGYFGAYPNNKILWEEIAFVTDKQLGRPDYRINTHKFHAENGGFMATPPSQYFYDLQKTNRVNEEGSTTLLMEQVTINEPEYS